MERVMRTVTPQTSANSYWNIIKHLSPEAKIDLITLLSQSLKGTMSHGVPAKKYYGIWGDDGMTDDEFVRELKSMRSLNRDIIEL